MIQRQSLFRIKSSQHFGRAQYYAVATVEDNRIASIEMREKIGQEDHSSSSDLRGHGFDASAQSRHARMLNVVSDCQVLIARGTLAPHASASVGTGAYESIRAAHIVPVVTDIRMIVDAIQEYLNGSLVNHTEKLH